MTRLIWWILIVMFVALLCSEHKRLTGKGYNYSLEAVSKPLGI